MLSINFVLTKYCFTFPFKTNKQTYWPAKDYSSKFPKDVSQFSTIARDTNIMLLIFGINIFSNINIYLAVFSRRYLNIPIYYFLTRFINLF